MSLTHKEARRILEILDHTTHLDFLEVRVGDTTLTASKSGAIQRSLAPAQGAAPAKPAQPTSVAAASEPEVAEGQVAVRATMMGTFYRKPSPDQPSFVEENATVETGAPLCLVEAMKLFNTLASPVKGRVVRIVAQDLQMVQRDQLLMIIEPEAR
ncbi:acetyl-CoA carboxylase, biotin carboxyl carrier protein [Pseudomonas sp. PCH199]|uniref:acetyl-CoA carboxylase biotin carboxyl carrier protein n=1 Tax=unclassified Pseudomonas TaxID=196821 RepID=UPI0015AC8E4B|nr:MULTISPECIES: biotin/lipoyl-containing protein [unclassified Pseudomonas]MCW8278527.1 acetyl-CoA carboxylase, biotin carboxyl carrier protein [Pseudomonas sp. PCH199]